MKLMEDRIKKDGLVESEDILKVGSFLNQQIDVDFICQCGEEFYRLYREEKLTKIMTIEASGIGLACLCALPFHIPVIFAKKSKSKNINGEIYTASAYSFTHDVTNTIVLPKALLSSADRVLILDDFLANGSAAEALVSLCKQAKAEIAGVGVFVEKAYQGGSEKLRKEGIRVDALAKIKSMDPQKGIEFC